MSDQLLEERQPLEGRVATILNERELVINIGTNSGVQRGMKFKVLAQTPTEIHDPDTGEMLGVVDREKVRVQVAEVQEKFAICKTYRTVRIKGGALYDLMVAGSSFSGLAQPPEIVRESLRADESSLPPPLTESESYIKRGDRVIQLMRDD